MIEKETNNFEFAKINSISKKKNIETAFKKFQKMPADANIIAKGYLWANSNCSKTVVTCENPLMDINLKNNMVKAELPMIKNSGSITTGTLKIVINTITDNITNEVLEFVLPPLRKGDCHKNITKEFFIQIPIKSMNLFLYEFSEKANWDSKLSFKDIDFNRMKFEKSGPVYCPQCLNLMSKNGWDYRICPKCKTKFW